MNFITLILQLYTLLACFTLMHIAKAQQNQEPNPPKWPSSVHVFAPTDDMQKIQDIITAAYNTNGGHTPSNHGQFSSERFAFLFKPGSYDVDCPVGYYTQVLGLGKLPSDVEFTSPKGVYSQEQDFTIGGALSTFWRSAENFKSSATNKWYVGVGMMWAVSQAAPLRRIEIENNLLLYEYEPPIPGAGEASGGYFSNIYVHNTVSTGSQQQWFARDSTINLWQGGVWNMVISGIDGKQIPPNHCGNHNGTIPMTTIEKTPVISEKPYIKFDVKTEKFFLQIPPLKHNSHGADFIDNDENGNNPILNATQSIDFSNVYVTQLDDTAMIMNEKLNKGLHLLISPGIYHLDQPLVINKPNQIILGLGLATLVSAKQNILISIGSIDGVRICGLILQAGPDANGISAPTLLEWGRTDSYHAGNPQNPGFLHDVFARVGGPDGTSSNPVAANSMVHIRNGNVIGDNMWLWRADHADGGAVTYDSNPCDNGMVIDGNDVTMYGLAVEHTEKDLTIWNGENGHTYFYQSELPYGVTQEEYGNYVGYHVASNVKQHAGYGIGVYSFFRDHNVTVKSGIKVPHQLESNFVHPFTVFLNGHGGILHIINDKGNASTYSKQKISGGNVHYLCDFN